MGGRRAAVEQPIVDELRLIDLAETDSAAIRAGGHHEGQRYVDADLSGRDLTGVSFSECEFLGLAANETQLRGARFAETRIERLDAPVLTAARTTWRDVQIDRSRLGAAELYEADLHSVVLRASKLTYVNLRSAVLRDVLVSHCTIDELDLTHVRAERVAFEECSVRTVRFDHAQLQHVDLRGLDMVGAVSGIDAMRGTVITPAQAVRLSEALTQHLGIAVVD